MDLPPSLLNMTKDSLVHLLGGCSDNGRSTASIGDGRTADTHTRSSRRSMRTTFFLWIKQVELCLEAVSGHTYQEKPNDLCDRGTLDGTSQEKTRKLSDANRFIPGAISLEAAATIPARNSSQSSVLSAPFSRIRVIGSVGVGLTTSSLPIDRYVIANSSREPD